MLARDSKNRPPPKQIRLLLPIWGHKYVQDFLNVSLPTWLAPGNLPSLKEALPTEFVFLTSREDAPYLKAHSGFKRLSSIFKVKMHFIDHLITGSNYATTITLSYLEGVREVGDEIVDTCFFFLVSDYIIADGSLHNVLQRMLNGSSGVLAGNFQLSEESARPWLDAQINHSPETLSLSPRQMMGWAMTHLHPNTVANTVNFGLSHNSHTNRLFWSVDSQSLIGRFFLMHMICIRPELTDFMIGAACDYSFIPEMCPSDNVQIITDSDEYLVLEMQPAEHESSFLRPGMLRPEKLAKILGEWATERHRRNATTTVLFHAGDAPDRLEEVSQQADRFLDYVQIALPKLPIAHRGHPYWSGAIAAQKESMGLKLHDTEWPLAFGIPDPRLDQSVAHQLFFLIFRVIFGRPPNVRRWHPRWPDYHLVLDKIRKEMSSGKRLLLIADRVTPFSAGLPDGTDRVVRIKSSQFLRRSSEALADLAESFDVCLIEFAEGDLLSAEMYTQMERANRPNSDNFLTMAMVGGLDDERLLRLDASGDYASIVVPLESLDGTGIGVEALIDRVAPLMRHEGKMLISVQGDEGTGNTLAETLAKHANQIMRPYALRTSLSFVRTTGYRGSMLTLQMTLARSVAASKSIGAWVSAALLAPFFLASNVLQNRRSLFSSMVPPGKPISSALFEIVTDARITRDVGEYSSQKLLRDRVRRRRGLGTLIVQPDGTFGKPYDLDFLLSPGDGRVSHTQKLPANHAGAKEAPND